MESFAPPPEEQEPNTVNWTGIWPGYVVDDRDPLKRGRVRIRIPQVYGADSDPVEQRIPDDRLPWARPCFPVTGAQDGDIKVPQLGAGVWAMFWAGDPEHPVWLGGFLGDGDAAAEFASSYTPGPKTNVLTTPGKPGVVVRTPAQLVVPGVRYEAVQPGTAGNAVTVEHVATSGAPGTALDVAFAGSGLVVTFARDGGGNPVAPTAQDLVSAVNADNGARAVLRAAPSSGDPAALPETNLAGGTQTTQGATHHRFELRWVEGEEKIELEDSEGSIIQLLGAALGGPRIVARTPAGRILTLDDSAQKASMETLTQRVVVDDLAQRVEVFSNGEVVISSGGLLTLATAGGLAVGGPGGGPAGGAVNIESGGAENKTFTGSANHSYAAFTLNASLALAITSLAVATITGAGLALLTTGAAVLIGTLAGTKLALMNINLIAAFNAHAHAALGAPPTQTIFPGAPPPFDQNTMVTTKVLAE